MENLILYCYWPCDEHQYFIAIYVVNTAIYIFLQFSDK